MNWKRSGRALSVTVASLAFAVAVLSFTSQAFACQLCQAHGIQWTCCLDEGVGDCCWWEDLANPGHFWWGCRRLSTGTCVTEGYGSM